MAQVAINKTLSRQTTEQVQVTTAHLVGFMFLFDAQMAAIEVAFRTADGTTIESELWVVKGSTLVNALDRAPVGGTRSAVIAEAMEWIVDTVENTKDLKDSLIADGTITLAGGSLVGGVAL